MLKRISFLLVLTFLFSEIIFTREVDLTIENKTAHYIEKDVTPLSATQSISEATSGDTLKVNLHNNRDEKSDGDYYALKAESFQPTLGAITPTPKPPAQTNEVVEEITFDLYRSANIDNYTVFTRIEGSLGDAKLQFGPGKHHQWVTHTFNISSIAKYKMTSSPGRWQIRRFENRPDNELKLDDRPMGDNDFNDKIIRIRKGKGTWKEDENGDLYYIRYDQS